MASCYSIGCHKFYCTHCKLKKGKLGHGGLNLHCYLKTLSAKFCKEIIIDHGVPVQPINMCLTKVKHPDINIT